MAGSQDSKHRTFCRSFWEVSGLMFILTACQPTLPVSSPALPSLTPTIALTSPMTGEDGMDELFVPAGEFTMGSNAGLRDERPEHLVDLRAFWIDRTEITNKMYAHCMDQKKCASPRDTSSSKRPDYFRNSQFADFPVIQVDWNMANEYCQWAGRRLPTEAEWEKAARGMDASAYPWGNGAPDKSLLNYYLNIGDTTEVGSYPNGKSIYGALDMAGNVSEWVSSSYRDYPYDANDGREDLGPSDSRVVRGGSWNGDDLSERTTFRSIVFDYSRFYDHLTGFRCAQDISP